MTESASEKAMAPRSPRVLHLSAVDFGGAGIAALRLHVAMRQRGHDSEMLVWETRSKSVGVFSLGGNVIKESRRWLARVWHRIATRRNYIFRNQSAGYVNRTKLINIAKRISPTLVVVHYISDFLNFDDILAIQEQTGANIVFHPLDMGLFTGGCHYDWQCGGYEKFCHHCPATPAQRGTAARTLAGKTNALRQLQHEVIAPSSHLLSQLSQSQLFREAQIHKSLLGLDPDHFGQLPIGEAKNKFAIGNNRLVLLFGAQNISDPRKGFDLLVNALLILRDQDESKEREITLLIVGNGMAENCLAELDMPAVVLGYVDSARLKDAYCAADIFVCPSVEDSGPMMVNEAMMSGTAVVGFRTGVLPDLVIDGETGQLAESVDSNSLASAITKVIDWSSERRMNARRACKAHAISLCSTDTQVRSFVALSNSGGTASIRA